MARVNALDLVAANGSTPSELAELYGYVIDNVELGAVSSALKNRQLSGDFSAGSIEARRFLNTSSSTYGTARTAGAGGKIKSSTVTIKKDTYKEIIEEIEAFDLKNFGVGGIVARQADNHALTMIDDLDVAFFAKAVEAGTATVHSATTVAGKLEEMIVEIESTKDNYNRGVKRNMIAVTLTPAWNSALRLEIDELPAQDNFYAKGAVGVFHGCPVYVSVNLGTGINAVVMAVQSIAQPVQVTPYAVKDVPFGDGQYISLFYYFGTEATAPELIRYSEEVGS